MTPDGMWKAYLAMGRLAQANAMLGLSAAEVVWRRSAMMATGAMSGPEATRMFMEKPTAFADAAQKAAMAAVRGGDAVSVASAAIRPLRRKTQANARRLRS